MGRLKAREPRLQPRAGRLAPRAKQADRFYRSKGWADKRIEKLKVDGAAYCIACGAGDGSGRGLILDHRVERKDGGADLPPVDQLDWYCIGCHNSKTAQAKAQRALGGGRSGPARGG